MYQNRTSAGYILAENLSRLTLSHPCLLAIPRGGVLVAAPVADKLNLPLDILITKKIGHPLNPEVAVGAVMPDGTTIWNEALLSEMNIHKAQLQPQVEEKYREIQQRLTIYTGSDSVTPAIRNQTVIIIDDGIATGYTIRAAVLWLKSLAPAKIILAVPVAPPDVLEELAGLVDQLVCPLQPLHFQAVGLYYQDFHQNTDAEVIHILRGLKVQH
ncbi:MAG: phosphoribosyltransferase family protein [Veillonellales bacterium]